VNPGEAARAAFHLETIGTLATAGATAASEALSLLTRRDAPAGPATAALRPVDEIALLLGGDDEPTVAVHFAVPSAPGAHLVVTFDPRAAVWLDGLLAPADEAAPADLRRSILLEAGNILAGAFLSAIANRRRGLLTSPPSLAVDMAGALLDGPLVELTEGRDRALVLETALSARGETGDRPVGRILLLFPPEGPGDLLEPGS